jgi:hypothetical protein
MPAPPTELWYRIDHADPRAVAMADRHYSRQTPGSPEFTRPGNKIVLLHYAPDGSAAALWASQRPDPASGVPRSDGLEAWDCSIFRIEQRTVPASALIRAAVGITASVWGAAPRDGFVTTIDPRHVAPTMRRGKPVYGYCYLMAGWRFLRITSERKLHMVQLPAADIAPLSWVWDRPIFGNVRRRWDRPIDPLQLRLEEATHARAAD